MSVTDVAVAVLLAVAGVVAAGAAVGAVLVGDLAGRLHLVTPVTSVSGPAVGLAAALTLGWSTSTAGVLLVVVLLAVTAPVLSIGIARAAAAAGDTAPTGGPAAGDGVAP